MNSRMPRAGVDGWELRSGVVAGSAGETVSYLERPGSRAAHVERYFPDGCDCFRNATAPQFTTTRASSSPARKTPLRTSPGSEWDLRTAESPFEVVFTAAARRSFADLGYGSGYEVGGGLWGYRDGNTLIVRFATQNNEGGYGGESTSRVRMSLPSLAQHAHAYRDLADLLGTWHSHEAYEGRRAQPSNLDLTSWANAADDTGMYLGLILSKGTDDPTRGAAAWLWPRFSAWVARKTATGTVIEPASLTIDTDS